MKSIFLRPLILNAIRAHHSEIVGSIRELSLSIQESVCLYDLLLAPQEPIGADKWVALQVHWADALSNQQPAQIDTLLDYYSPSELAVKKTLFPFLLQMRRKPLWQTITSPDPEPENLIDLTRWTVHWGVMLAIKRFWLHKVRTEGWQTRDYVGMPAMTTPVLNCAAFLYGDCVRGSIIQSKTIHTRVATEIGKSEIYVNSAFQIMGQKLK